MGNPLAALIFALGAAAQRFGCELYTLAMKQIAKDVHMKASRFALNQSCAEFTALRGASGLPC